MNLKEQILDELKAACEPRGWSIGAFVWLHRPKEQIQAALDELEKEEKVEVTLYKDIKSYKLKLIEIALEEYEVIHEIN